MLEPRLKPPASGDHVSVARLNTWWYVACAARDLSDKPMPVRILGIPMVLFRDSSGRAAALLDRCPHRNVPLSLGRVSDDGRLECVYHGWRFDGAGRCTHVPALCNDRNPDARRVEAFPTREQDGLIWVLPNAAGEASAEPFALPLTQAPGYATVIREVSVEGTLHAAVENALDVPHTAFLHGGLFRTAAARNRIQAVVRRWHDRVEAQYIGEPRPSGLAARLISPSGGEVSHWDRFFLPSVAQVEYRIGDENHFLVTTAMTPVSDFQTRMFAVISFKLRVPARLVLPILEPLAMRIFKQDAEILAAQTATIREFGGEAFLSTEIDILGAHIWRLLKRAEQGTLEAPRDQPEVEREVTLEV